MRTLGLVAILVVGCGSKKDDGPAAKPAGSAAASAAAGVELQIYVDDQPVAKVDLPQVASWPRLDSLVPEQARRLGKWQAISLTGAKSAELSKPFETYRDYVPVLFPGDGGTISFGMFDPVELGKRGTPVLREDAITELRVKLDASGMRGGNDHGGGEVTDPADIKLAFKTKAGVTTLDGPKLLAIPREPMPGGGGEAKGWRLRTLLAAGGVTKFAKLLVHDANGMTLPIEAKELDAGTIPFIKLNRQGQLRFRVYKRQGEGWQTAGDLRQLAKIEVLD